MTETKKFSNYRWTVCALIFFATTVNYLDRQVIGILKPLLESDLGIGEKDYSHIIMAFQLLYGIGMVIAGRLIDKFGTKLGYGVAVILWSFAAMGHALAKGVWGFGFWRGFLGVSEAGNFPAAIKTVAEWFPKKERALATGIFNSGTNVGALLSPLVVPWIAGHWGWQWAFIITGALGFLWVASWLVFYRDPDTHPCLKPSELAYIRSDPADSGVKVPWRSLLPHRQTWAFALGKFMTDPIWWLYLFWVPDFLNKNYGVGITVSQLGPPLITIYLIADLGSVGGGWLSSHFLKKGWRPDRARKAAMLVCALCVVPVVFAASGVSKWTAVLIISLAAAAHQGWSANLFTLASDMFPRRAVGSIVGIGGMAGAVGGMFIAMLVGAILQATGNYLLIFVIAGFAYLAALTIIHLFAPKLEPAKL